MNKPSIKPRKLPTKKNTGNILILDDEEIVHLTIKRLLRDEEYTIDSAFTPSDGIEKLKDNKYDLLVSDICMPGVTGVDVLKKVRKQGIDIEVLMMTGYATLETATKAMSYGARDYLLKPFEDTNLFKMKVEEAVNITKTRRENKANFKEHYEPELRSLKNVFGVDDVELANNILNVSKCAYAFLGQDGKIAYTNSLFPEVVGVSYSKLADSEITDYVVRADKLKLTKH